MKIQNYIYKHQNKIGLFLILVFYFLYSYGYRNFAELHIILPGFNIPIFIGELLFIVCFFLALPEFLKMLKQSKALLVLLLLFLLFILVKTSVGFKLWGELALRNSAMFYYVLFSGLAYCFYDKKILGNKILLNIIFFSILFLVFSYDKINHYFFYIYWMLLSVLAIHISRSKIELIIRFLLIAFLIFSYPIFETPRIWLISYIFAIGSLILSLFATLKIEKRIKFCLSLIPFILLSVVFIFNPSRKFILNYLAINKIKEGYVSVKQKIEQADLKIGIRKQIEIVPEQNIPLAKQIISTYELVVQKSTQETNQTSSIEKVIVPTPTEKIKQVEIPKGKNHVKHSLNNILWRVLVWEDMLKELLQNNIIFGVDFGKPFLSIQLKKLGWVQGLHTGWIEPHNSYIHMLYRGGILALFLIIGIWYGWISILFRFIKRRDIKGLFLCSALSYFLIFANSMVMFELPYFAIPFWSLFGLTLGYCYKK